jgi:predicted transcriptional regulator
MEKSKSSKTETIKERAIYVYLPSHKMTLKWKNLAEKAGVSISKFVIEHVENSLQQEDSKQGYVSRVDLLDEMKKIKEENERLHKDNKMLDNLGARLEEELRGYRVKPFLEENYSGIRKYETELIKLLKSRGEVRKEGVLEYLGINPMDTDVVKGIKKQIENLEHYGLVKDMGGKWQWKG